MNVGLVIYGSLETVSGGYLYDRKLVEHLRSCGDRVEIFSLPWRNYARHLLDNLTIGLLDSLGTTPLDVLIEDELNHPSLFVINEKLRRRAGYQIVSIVHHLRCSELRPAWQNRFYSMVERKYLATVDGFVFNSRTTQATVEVLVGSGMPSTVAHPGRHDVAPVITNADLETRAAQAGPLRIVSVGNVIHRKNMHALIAALALLPRESWRLEIVGGLEIEPDYVSFVRSEIKRHECGDQVQLLGTLTGGDLRERYLRSQLLAVPSSYEGFGIVYLEGMGFGLPALASTVGAAHEIITDGENGFLVHPSDTRAMAERIHKLHEDRTKLAAMSLAARETFCSHPTWTQCAATIRSFLQDMVTRS